MVLQIYVYGPTESGFLDTNPDSSLELESLSDVFDEDLSTGDFSLPMDLPWTENNRRLLGFPERLENFKSTSIRQWKCIVFEDGFPELPNAMMTMIDKTGFFNYHSGKFSMTISGAKGVFGAAIKNKTMPMLFLDGPITWTAGDSRTFATGVMKGYYPQYKNFVFVPVAIEGFMQKDRPDYDNEFLAKDVVNWVELAGGTWSFTNPAGSPVDSFRTVPFFKLKYVLVKIFEEHGYTLTGDFLTSTDFDDVLIFNNYALEKYAALTDYNRTITPGNHLPNIPINEFLAGVFSYFNMFPVFNSDNSVNLVYRVSNMTQRKVLSLNDICGKEFESTFNEGVNTSTTTQNNGYKLVFGWSQDGFHGDRVKEGQFINQRWDGTTNQWYGDWSRSPKEKVLVATVDTTAYLGTLNIGRALTTDDMVFVKADNMYYIVADSTSIPIKWDAFAEELEDYVSGNGERSVDIKLSPLCQYIEFNTDTALNERRNYVGTRQAGSYINNNGVRVSSVQASSDLNGGNDFGLHLFYGKMLNIGGTVIPTSFYHNRDTNNNKIENYSLAWYGDDGMAANFHDAWQQLKNNLEVVKVPIYATKKVIQDLADNNTLEIGGIQFLPYKVDRAIPLKGKFDLYLTPL